MPCGWCGSHHGVRMVRRDGVPMRSPVAGVPLHLCFRCWGTYNESGMRADQTGRPRPGRISGVPMSVPILRGLGRS